MRQNIAQLHQKLMASARAHAPSDHVPYGFEKRITALLSSRVAPDHLTLWVHGLWRAAISCVALTLLFGTWAMLNPDTSSSSTADLSQNFESTLLAAVDQSEQAQ